MHVLMVGLGSAGQRHLRNLRVLLGPEATFSAFRTHRRRFVITDQVQADFSRDIEGEEPLHVFSCLSEALSARPNLTVIANPNALHIPVALEAAQAGSHLFIEKPLSHSEEDVERLIDLVGRQRLVAMVGYQMRFHPALQLIRTLLLSGRIGYPLSAWLEIGEYLPGMHPYEDYRGAYTAQVELGGGVVLSQSHEIDYACWLFGAPQRVFAVGGQRSRLELKVEDTADILMECAGANGRTFAVHIHQNFVQRPPIRTCRLLGDAGTITCNLLTGVLTIENAETGLVETHDFAGLKRNQMFLDEMRHLLACIRGEARPLVGLEEGRLALQVALLAKRSMELGQGLPCTSSH